MSLPGWPHEASPFHSGEREAQQRAGMRDKIEAIGRRVVRNVMPDQHREFFAQLPFVLLGAVDGEGQPWATLLTGEPGFMGSPDERSLSVGADLLPGDPLTGAIWPGARLGLLGIEPATRRRNRMNGVVTAATGQGFSVEVEQSFGNCPKYVTPRDFTWVPAGEPQAPVHLAALDEATTALIRRADTFYIATAHLDDTGAPSQGVDVSHRGGPAGFVQIDDAETLTWPDYIGNFLFNTLGNLLVNPRAGLVFADFERRELLHIAGRGEVIWEGDEVAAVEGAQRLVRFHVEQVVRRPGILPLRERAGG